MSSGGISPVGVREPDSVPPGSYVGPMWCSACGTAAREPLCHPCRRSCVPASDRIVGNVVVRAPYLHEGAARQLVLHIKYGGSPRALSVLADAIAAIIDPSTTALVPVPRTWVRRWRYGIDPAKALAREVSRRTGIPVVPALRAPVGGRANAGAPRAQRQPPAFTARGRVAAGAVLVDDVVTTGRTINAAAGALGGVVGSALSATSVRGVTSLLRTADPGGTWT